MRQGIHRIGIYPGTFNPVHAGHIAFALQVLKDAGLDAVYFMPERRPRFKRGVEHYAYRLAMLKRAVQPHPRLGVLDTDDISFTVRRTLPHLQRRFRDSQLVLLTGSDVAPYIPTWQHAGRLLAQVELVIGLRDGNDRQTLVQNLNGWHTQPVKSSIIESFAPDVSAKQVREGLRRRQSVRGILPSVRDYSNRHWLYVSFV